MLHHVSLGVRDVASSAKFYDAVLGKLGLKRKVDYSPHAVAYARGASTQFFWVQLPHDGKAPSVGNGVHIAFEARSRAEVHAFYDAALALGGQDDGAPGPRPEYTASYYGAFVRDLDGNKIEAMLNTRAKAKPAKKAASKSKTKTIKKPKKAAKKIKKKKARRR
jgi:catechol 2,3-dioxygenase-like lactoylglutathione lyase family enzyme